MSRELRDRQLARLCDVLDAVPGQAPTLCEGWTAHDLAIHVWSLSHDPVSWPAAGVPALAGWATRRGRRVTGRWSYAELVDRLRHGSGAIGCMPTDALEGHRHALGEYFIHTEDVARAHDIDRPAADDALDEALWKRCRVAAPVLHWRTPGLVLAHEDAREVRVTPGRRRLVVRGRPTELLCWIHGRTAVADVTVEHT